MKKITSWAKWLSQPAPGIHHFTSLALGLLACAVISSLFTWVLEFTKAKTTLPTELYPSPLQARLCLFSVGRKSEVLQYLQVCTNRSQPVVLTYSSLQTQNMCCGKMVGLWVTSFSQHSPLSEDIRNLSTHTLTVQ